MNYARKYIIDIAIVITVIIAMTIWQSRDLSTTDSAIPDISLGTLAGTQVSLKNPGKHTVLFIFAPWCQVCHACVGNFNQIAGDQNVSVIGIAFDYQSRDELQKMKDDENLNFPIALGNEQVRESLKFSAYPTFYIVDGSGKIVSGGVGYISSFGLWWRLKLATI